MALGYHGFAVHKRSPAYLLRQLLPPVWDGSTPSHSNSFSQAITSLCPITYGDRRHPCYCREALDLLCTCSSQCMWPFNLAFTTVWCWEGRRSAGKQRHAGVRWGGYGLQRCFFWHLSLSCGADAGICAVNKVQMEENHMVTVSPPFSLSKELSSMHRPCKKCVSSHIFPMGSP